MTEIEELRRQGLSISQISATMGIDRKTTRKYLREPRTPVYGPRPPRGSLLDPFEDYIQQRLAAGVWNGSVLLTELKERGYQGQYTILCDYLRPLRQGAQGVAVRRFETPPGKQAQVDWGVLGDIVCRDGTRYVLYGFVMILGNSRAMFADVCTDQSLGSLIRMHEAAFHYLGGVPEQVLYDNMKTVALGYDERGEPQWNTAFADFAGYWGFTPRLCRPYRPQTKGKIERGIGYIRQNFLCGREADDLEDLRRQLAAWLAQVANARIHGTTGRVVQQAWDEEKPALQPLGNRPAFCYIPEMLRRVSADAFVSYRRNRYSVPWRSAGQEVSLTTREGHLEIWHEGTRLASHPLCEGKYQRIIIAAHHDGIPLGPSRRAGKRRIHICEGGPTVQVRSLSAYEELIGMGGDA